MEDQYTFPRTMEEMVSYARAWAGCDFIVMDDKARQEYWILLNGNDPDWGKKYLAAVADMAVLFGGKRIITPTEYGMEFVKEGDKRTKESMKVRFLATFHIDQYGNPSFGKCSRMFGNDDWTTMDKDLFTFLHRFVKSGTMVELKRNTYTEASWYYVWDEEFDV